MTSHVTSHVNFYVQVKLLLPAWDSHQDNSTSRQTAPPSAFGGQQATQPLPPTLFVSVVQIPQDANMTSAWVPISATLECSFQLSVSSTCKFEFRNLERMHVNAPAVLLIEMHSEIESGSFPHELTVRVSLRWVKRITDQTCIMIM